MDLTEQLIPNITELQKRGIRKILENAYDSGKSRAIKETLESENEYRTKMALIRMAEKIKNEMNEN